MITGLSPRLRGNQSGVRLRKPYLGSIPAPAGEPTICGQTLSGPMGLSPRLRGNQYDVVPFAYLERSIPALAGEPAAGQVNEPVAAVYPRACGGTRNSFPIASNRYGLSPRLRGNHPHQSRCNHNKGSIPAPAGEPNPMTHSLEGSAVYPRACGGTRGEPLVK